MIDILDFTRLLPGPLATKLLAEQGAKVTKLELPYKPDPVAMQPPFTQEGVSTLYQLLNHNKKIEELDYTRYQSDAVVQARLDELLAKADILIEQYRPGVMSVWGLGYEQLKEKYPKLIYISITGYGQKGALAQAAGHDITYLAYSGILSLNRDEQGVPVIPNIQIADIAAGSYPAITACYKALYERSKTGRGQWVDVSMLDNLKPLLSIPLSQHLGGWSPNETNFLGGLLVNYNVYRCADGKWVALGALEIKFWNNFCLWVGKAEWQRNNPLELSKHVFPKKEVDALFLTKTRDEWAAAAAGKDVCLAPIMELIDN